MRYFVYGVAGKIEKTKELVEIAKRTGKETYGTIEEVFDDLYNYYNSDVVYFDKVNLGVSFYGYDTRLERDVFIVTTNRFLRENYNEHPQFLKFLIIL